MAIRIKPSQIAARGFTLIEVVVVVGVVAFIATITLISFPEFSERVGVEQGAAELALAFRKAQNYALAVREFRVGSGVFPAYGVFIDLAEPTKFLVFADPNSSNRYESFFGELIENFEVSSRVRIAELCGNSQSIPSGPCSLSSIEVVYVRPAPTIILTGIEGGIPLIYNDIKVVLRSLDGSIEKNVIVWSTGQVSIE